MDIEKLLSAPFPLSEVQVRAGALSKDKTRCIVLHYLESRTVMRRLDEVFGLMGWGTRITHMAPSGHDRTRDEDVFAVGLELYVFLPDATPTSMISKSDVGIGTDYKNATSDALKRAAVQLGIGRYLYDLPVVWADYDAEKRIPVNVKPLATSLLPDRVQTPPDLPITNVPASGTPLPASMPGPLPDKTALVCPKCNKPLNKAGIGWLKEKTEKDPNFSVICPPCYSLQGKAAQ